MFDSRLGASSISKFPMVRVPQSDKVSVIFGVDFLLKSAACGPATKQPVDVW